jgi:hypothetical protein
MSNDNPVTGYLGDTPLLPSEVREVWLLQQGPWSPEAQARVLEIKRIAEARHSGSRS